MTEPGPLPSGLTPWPAGLAERYRAEGYWEGRTLGARLRDWASRHPGRTALVAGPDRLTYAELDRRVDRMAAGIRERGIGAGDRVVVQLPNVAAFVVAFFALVRAGAIPVLTLPAHRIAEVGALTRLSEAVAYLTVDWHAGFDYRPLAAAVLAAAPSLRDVLIVGDAGPYTPLAEVDAEPVDLAEPDPAEIALLLISGGTTGVPKLIPRTHDDYGYNARASSAVCGLTAESVYLGALPIAHNFALACPGVLGTLGVGGRVVLSPSAAPDDAFPLVEAERVTMTAVVPPLLPVWLDAAQWNPADLSSLTLLQVGGSKLSAEVARAVPAGLGCAVQQVYGMAEGLLNYTRAEDDARTVATTQGRPLCAADELRIVDGNGADGDGADVVPGTVGQLLVRGPYTVRGYYRACEHNLRAFTADGYYRTGDLVRALPSGHLIVEGRVKDTIDRGGESVSAEEVEGYVGAHPAVLRCAAFGLAGGSQGERICVIVVPAGEPPTLHELRSFLTARGVAAFKLPDRIETATDLPLTAVGKVDKRALVREYGPSDPGPPS